MWMDKVQFGVVREDPQAELDLISKFSLNSVLLIGSGGCTALSIKAEFPDIHLSVIEPNPAQIKLIKKKIMLIKKNTLKNIIKTISIETSESLIESGHFESLFKMLREFIYEFVISKSNLLKLMQSNSSGKWKSIFQNPFWKIAFDLYFSDALLITMFGRDAVQYAPKNSYPSYFRNLIEKGLTRPDARTNYFLHHIFFGHYLKGKKNWPPYLQKLPSRFDMDFHECYANQYADYNQFNFVSLSNIFDWSPRQQIKQIAKKISKQMRPGSVLIYRHLNNPNSFKSYFKGFKWQVKLEKQFLDSDRSLFYSKICVGRKYE